MNRYAVAAIYKFDLPTATSILKNIKTNQSSFEVLFASLIRETS